MAKIEVQTRIQVDTLLPADDIVNTWHFRLITLAYQAAESLLVTNALTSFYQSADASMGDYASGVASHRVYDMDDPPPRVPKIVVPFTVTPSGAAAAPELACCVSFEGVLISGTIPERRRGRIYFGPIRTASVGSDGLLTAGILNDLDTAATALLAASEAATDWSWDVYSPTANTFTTVDHGWIDNAPDVQRRRGRRATLRQAF